MRKAAIVALLLCLAGCMAEPRPFDPRACDVLTADRVLTEQHGEGPTPVDVTLLDGVTGGPAVGHSVIAIHGFDNVTHATWDLDPSLNECAVAATVTDGDGSARLLLYPDMEYWIAAPYHQVFGPETQQYTAEVTYINTSAQTSVTLHTFPMSITLTWNGTFAAVDPSGDTITEVRNMELFPPGSGLVERFDAFQPKSTLTWNNDLVSWADLHLGLAVGNDARFTNSIHNDEQDANSGMAEEDSFGQWISFDEHECQALQRGLTLVVYDPGPAQAHPQDPVRFTWTLDLKLESPLDPFTLDC